jgi:hypothetical protein
MPASKSRPVPSISTSRPARTLNRREAVKQAEPALTLTGMPFGWIFVLLLSY